MNLENALDPVYYAVQGADQNEIKEILDEEQELNIDLLTIEELEPLELSIKQLGALENIINMEEV